MVDLDGLEITDQIPIPNDHQILLVDDQEFNLQALEIILKYNCKVDTDKICVKARSGKKAIDIIKEDMINNKYISSSYKLILLDYEMPEMNGPETCRQIREMLYFEGID